MSSMIYALKSVPGLADVGVPHGDAPRTQPRDPDVKKILADGSVHVPCNSFVHE